MSAWGVQPVCPWVLGRGERWKKTGWSRNASNWSPYQALVSPAVPPQEGDEQGDFPHSPG